MGKLLALCLVLNTFFICTRGLYYDGSNSYSIYPRLDLQLCSNSSLSFDFTVSTATHSMGYNNNFTSSSNIINNNNPYGRLLIYSEQQLQVNSIGNTKKLVNSYFLVKLVSGNRLIVNDYWTANDITFQLPNDYMTSWFRFVYTRKLTTAEINLYKFETTKSGADQISSVKLVLIFSKQVIHTNFIFDELISAPNKKKANNNIDQTQIGYSNLLVGGLSDYLNDKNFSFAQLKSLSKFHGYIMNLQYTSLASQCSTDMCSKSSISQRQYAIFSSSTSKQYKLQQFVDKDSLIIDDICESDTLTHDICPRDCSCLSNNFVAPYFNCDCSDSPNTKQPKCSALYKSFALNFDDANYFGNVQEKFDYPILPSFTKINVQNVATVFDKNRGVQFKNSASRLYLMPSSDVPESDSCFWNIDDCPNGFVQHIIMSIDKLDEKKFNHKVVLFVNGYESSSKFVSYLYKNRLYFSLYENDENVEWLVSSGPLDKTKYLNRQLKITISWLREKYLSLHFDGYLIDIITKPLTPPLNLDIYSNFNLNRFYYEYGVRVISSNSDKMQASSIINHQFAIKYIRRDYFNDMDVQDSKIIVSSPLPSEIIRIDNTQRVMYKIDSPLTGVVTETIELSFRTSQADGVIFYIRNNPIITYFELVKGQPVVVIDTRFKNVYLRPQTAPLNDNQWHEVKLHRDGQTVSINIDSQYHDSSDLGQSTNNQILTGGYVYLGLADPNNINLSDKKTFIGEMVRGKVTINNIQQKVVQQPYYWPSMPAITTNQTVNIDTSQLAHDGKMINIIINVYGPPGFSAGVNAQKTEADTHFIYLDNLPDTRYISVAPSDREIDFRVAGTRLEAFLIKFQTRQQCGQLVTLVNDPRNYIGLEVYDGYLYSSTAINGVPQRYQISRVRVDDGRIYQVNLKQEQQKLFCWLDIDDSYKQAIMHMGSSNVAVNTIRVAGQDGNDYGFSSRYGFVGCIGAILLNERDVIDYKFVSTERRQSCQNVIEQPVTPAPPPPSTPPPPPAPVSLGYISFTKTADILVYNFFYDHERPLFEDISFIFRTVVSNGILFSAHNNEDHNPHMIGAYIKDGAVHVVYLNSSFTQDLCFGNNIVDDGNLYRLNIRRNSNGHGFIQLQSYVGVTALDFYTQPGQIKFSKINVGGADEWSRIRFFGTRLDFVGCIIDLFQVNGNSVIKPADIPKERYNCNVERPRPLTTTTTPRPTTPRQSCLPEGYPLSFSSSDDSITYQHEPRVCEHIHIPFRTREARGIIYSHSSEDGNNFIIVYLRRGFINIIAKDNSGEKELELDSQRVDDGGVHKLDIYCKTEGYLIAYIDQNRQVSSNRIELYSPIYLNTYTLGYFNSERLSSKYSVYDSFRGCLEQITFNSDCLIYESFADRYRLSCSVQSLPLAPVTTTTTKRPTCTNTCHQSEDQCVVDLDSRGYLIYQAAEANAQSGNGRDQIRMSFMVRGQKDQDQDLLTIHHPDRNIRLYLSGGQPMIDIRGRCSNIGQISSYNDAKWHRLIIEKNNQDLIIRIDEQATSEYIPFEFDLLGSGRLFFGSSPGREALSFHGYFKDIYAKYSNVEYDIIASAKDTRIPGVVCEGHVVLKSYEDKPKLRCVSDPAVDSGNECATDGVCYASLWRNSSGVIERYMRCFNREQLQPAENPVLCRSQDPTRYVIQCCDTDYCNRDLVLKLKDLDEKDERSIWRFRGASSGDIEFVPYLQPARQAELSFQFNVSRPDGNVMCTRDDNLYLKAELVNQNLIFYLNDVKSKRMLKSVACTPRPGVQFNDNKWHKVQLIKRNRGTVSIICDDVPAQNLQYEGDIPFVNSKFGVNFGIDCVNDRARKLNGDLSQIVYVHDGVQYNFDDLQYTEDPRFTYENYVEFRPKFIAEVYSDPKPIFFRSSKSSARLDKWDDSKVGRISFEFKQEIPDENGLLFSTESGDSYFAIVINNGYLESVLSPYRVPNADSSAAVPFYDRYQRLFPHPKTKINDGQWHKLEFMVVGDSIGSFVLDDDFSSKIRFPITYWNDESPIVFGSNLDIERSVMGSFRGCLRNVVINNRLIDWSNKGTVYNVEAGCYNYRYAPNQLLFLQGQQLNDANSPASVQFNGDGCLKYNPNTRGNEKETVEFVFKTGGDQMVLFDSMGSEFIVHTQGPSIVVRSKDDSNIKAVMERGIVFNDGNLHKLKLEKSDLKVELELDSKYKLEFSLSRRNKLGPFFLGCSRDRKFKSKLVSLKDLKGSLLNLVYTSNGQNKIDLVEKLNSGDSTLLVDGSVLWSVSEGKPSANDNNKNENAITFKETSFLKLDKIDFDQNSNITFSFKTNENDGLLALLAPSVSSGLAQQTLSFVSSNYLAVELVNGSVSLVVYLDKQLKRISCSPTSPPSAHKLNDNKWHRVQIRRERLGNLNADSMSPTSSITLGCDNYFVRTKVSEQKLGLVQFNAGNLSSLLPSELWLSKNARYLGCIRDFRISQRPVDLYQQTTQESRATLQKGCQDTAVFCSKQSNCLNGGECVEGFGRTYCNCDSVSYTGAKCELGASTLSFNGSHGVELALPELLSSSSEDVSLRFRSRLRNGLLFALKKSADQPSLVISLEDGRIKCVYDRSKNDKVLYVGDQNLFNNNKWHTVHVKRNGPTVLVEVVDNEKNKYYAVDDLDIDSIKVSYQFVEIGSIKSIGLSQEHNNFIGSIQNLKLNGEDLLPYYLSDKPAGVWSVSGNADPGETSLLLHHQITFTSVCPITLPRTFSNERFSIHLFFKTSQENGVIFFRRGKEYRFMALELRNGKLKFVFELGGGIKQLSSEITNKNLNDKNWHEVTIKRFDRQKFSMKIDDFKELYVDIGSSNPPLSELESFVIGGIVPDYQKFDRDVLGSDGFIGCLASLEINNDAPNLYSSRLNLCSSVQHGCVDLSCNQESCYNNGVCSTFSNQVSCNCEMTSYTGPFCKDNSNYYFFGKQNRACGIIRYTIVPPNINQQKDRLAFGFTTTDSDALLVRIESDNGSQYIQIELKGGYVYLKININNNEETHVYSPGDKKFNDNTYHVVNLIRDGNHVQFRIDNFDQMAITLDGTDGIFRNQFNVYVGSLPDGRGELTNCYYGVMSGMFFNGNYILDRGEKMGDVGIVDYKYIHIEIDINQNRTRPLLPDSSCPLGYNKNENLCVFEICPLNSDQISDSCTCYQGYYEIQMSCVKRNETVIPPAPIAESSAKLIPAKTRIAEAPLGLIFGIISGIGLALLAAALAARKCSDGMCIPAKKIPIRNAGNVLHQTIASTSKTTNETYESNTVNRREEVPLIQHSSQKYSQNEDSYKDVVEFGRYPPMPQFITQSVNETTEIFEQTSGGGTAAVATTYNTGTMSHSAHHASHRDLDLLFYSQNNAADYELSNVNCFTMTPNGKYVIIGQSMGTPQIWDTLSGQLIRSMGGVCANCTNLELTCNGTLLVGLASDGSPDGHTQALQIWEVTSGKPIQMSHQIKCCVFAPSADTNSIFMAGNQRFGRGISVGILDLVTNELTKEIKSDPTISFGDNPESITVTPDERYAIVGCRSQQGTNFVVFDITKSTEIAQTRSIALDAEPKCIQILNSTEVLTGTRGGHLIQWNIHSCKPTLTFVDPMEAQAHRAAINQIAISSSNEFLVSASSDGTAKIWNTNTKSLVSVLSGHRAEVS